MDSSIFLAKLVGPVILALGIFVTFNPDRVARMGREVLASDALLLLSGILALPAGLAIVIVHNRWVADWPVLITGLGWIMLAAGLARILLPGVLQRLGTAMLDRPLLTTPPGIAMALIGAFLAWQGYAA